MIISCIHSVIVISGVVLPFYVDWYSIFFIIIMYHIQLSFLDGCILSKLEGGDIKTEGYVYHHFKKMGLCNMTKQEFNIYFDYIYPMILLMIAIIIQENGIVKSQYNII